MKDSKSTRKYRCPYCSYRGTRVDLVYHIQEEHEDMIPENFTPARLVFNKLNNKSKGICTVCGKETEWNEQTWSYKRICSEQCKKKYVQLRNERMVKVHGTTNMLKDPEHQIKMLSGRKISGSYKFSDGGVLGYTGTYEKNFLEFMDKVMGFKSEDIISPGHIIPYKFGDETLSFITDYYLIPFNLLFDIKPGGSNPNTHSGMEVYNAKQRAKEAQIKKDNKYNYIRLTDNDFSQLISVLMDIKQSLLDQNSKEKVIHINESVCHPPIGPNPNEDIHFITYSDTGNTVDGYGIVSNKMMDEVFVTDGNKLNKVDKDYFNDKFYTIFKPNEFVTDNVLEELNKVYNEQTDIEFDYCYKLLTGNNLISEEQLLYDDRFTLFYTSNNTDSTSYNERINEVVQTNIHYQIVDYIGFPILNETNIQKKNYLLESFTGLDILEDIDGFYVYNESTKNRSISFKDILDIPHELLQLMKDIRL